jgi:hypothetical protein
MFALDETSFVGALFFVMDCLADRLGHLIALAELDYSRVDALSGLGEGHTGQLVRGKLKYPAADITHAIAIVLGTTVGWLVAGEGDAPGQRKVRAAVKDAEGRLGRGEVRRAREGGAHRASRVRTAQPVRKGAHPSSGARSAGRARARG